MTIIGSQEKRFASFTLVGEKPIEFAISAENVLEATAVTASIQPLPASVDYLEGFMHLRDDVIAVINMKKRLGLARTDYGADAKVAVVSIARLRFGLLFDDIKDVFVAGGDAVQPLHSAFKRADSLISDLIKLDNGRRTMELLDLKLLLGNQVTLEQIQQADRLSPSAKAGPQKSVSRFVVFCCQGQEYGVPVDQVQEIAFLSKMDDVFKNDAIQGAVQLRGHTIPVLNATGLLQQEPQSSDNGEETRILVLNGDEFQYGLIVDKVREIICIGDDEIMRLSFSSHDAVGGVYQRPDGDNIMLIRVNTLIGAQQSELHAIARIKSNGEDTGAHTVHQSQHLITADCYLVFSIGRKFAIQLNDVQEIIEPMGLMELPAATGFDRRVLNLRGTVIPVIDLRCFYGYPDNDTECRDTKLIIVRSQDRIAALEVDRILTLHKQSKYQKTPSLNPQLQKRADTLDRLIEFAGDTGVNEHVLVINVSAMMDNHLGLHTATPPIASEFNTKEKNHGPNTATPPEE
jgi:purine-binding chemotaxis protein CheW